MTSQHSHHLEQFYDIVGKIALNVWALVCSDFFRKSRNSNLIVRFERIDSVFSNQYCDRYEP